MVLKIRLWQQGRKNGASYRVVVADVRSPRDGKYIEKIGFYDPLLKADTVKVDKERLTYWLSKGAQFTENAQSIIHHVAGDVITHFQNLKKEKKLKLNAKRRAKKTA